MSVCGDVKLLADFIHFGKGLYFDIRLNFVGQKSSPNDDFNGPQQLERGILEYSLES